MVRTTVQKFSVYLKFPLLRDLGLSTREETDDLFLKVEVYSQFDFSESYKADIRLFSNTTVPSLSIRSTQPLSWRQKSVLSFSGNGRKRTNWAIRREGKRP